MLPLRQARYCCAFLKEQAGAGTVTLIGIRAAESSRRAKRNEVEFRGRKFSGSLDQFNIGDESVVTCVNRKEKMLVSPIFHWTDKEVWSFIKREKMEYCSLYDEGFHRIGCMFCPMASVRTKLKEKAMYPGVVRRIKQSIQRLIDVNDFGSEYGMNADDVFDWYISNISMAKWAAMNKQQLKLPFED